MDKVRIGIIGCSEIAFRRFMPAASKINDLKVVAVSEEYAPDKLTSFCDTYGIEGSGSFLDMLSRDDLDAVYVPQPPALHYKWAYEALMRGKHVLIEKPSTISADDSKRLVETAKSYGLALHENYMFQYHNQINAIKNLMASGEIGDVRLIRCSFEFPKRDNNDFRYNKALGGGALYDAGGYTIKLASLLLGPDISVDTARLNYIPGFDVDMYGNATLSDGFGTVCQISFGMDCNYRCSLEVWGSEGSIYTNRIFTAPPDYKPIVIVENRSGKKEMLLDCDDHFMHSIVHFVEEIRNIEKREMMYNEIVRQSELVSELRYIAERDGNNEKSYI